MRQSYGSYFQRKTIDSAIATPFIVSWLNKNYPAYPIKRKETFKYDFIWHCYKTELKTRDVSALKYGDILAEAYFCSRGDHTDLNCPYEPDHDHSGWITYGSGYTDLLCYVFYDYSIDTVVKAFLFHWPSFYEFVMQNKGRWGFINSRSRDYITVNYRIPLAKIPLNIYREL